MMPAETEFFSCNSHNQREGFKSIKVEKCQYSLFTKMQKYPQKISLRSNVLMLN